MSKTPEAAAPPEALPVALEALAGQWEREAAEFRAGAKDAVAWGTACARDHEADIREKHARELRAVALQQQGAAAPVDAAALAGVREGLVDLLSGWRYIRQSGEEKIYGIGWDRAEDAGTKALAALDARSGATPALANTFACHSCDFRTDDLGEFEAHLRGPGPKEAGGGLEWRERQAAHERRLGAALGAVLGQTGPQPLLIESDDEDGQEVRFGSQWGAEEIWGEFRRCEVLALESLAAALGEAGDA